MIAIITDLWEKSNFNFVREHVFAHQDDLARPLSMLEKLNCRMDTLAKDIAREEMRIPQVGSLLRNSVGLGSITCDKTLITSKIQQSIYTQILHSKFTIYYAKKYSINSDLMTKEVHWKSFQLARKENRFGMNIFITKWISGDTATSSVMAQRKQRIDTKCPRCIFPEENTTHVLKCQEAGICELRENAMLELRIWMKSVHTQSDIEHFIFHGLTSWLANDSSFVPDDTMDPVILHACRYQLLLGWESMLHGILSKKIITCQQDHYSESSSRKLGSRWGVTLIKKLWDIIHLHWTHRNSILHATEAIDLLSGVGHLTLAVINEYEQGLGELPSVYTSYFVSPLAFILQKPTAFLKKWFLIIRSGRESCSIELPTDEFSTDPALRSWIGLQPLS